MSNADTIKEFLVALGFRVDGAGLKKYDNSIAQATASAMKLGAATAAVAATVEAFVAKVTDGLEKLYYASQRTGATVAGLKAFGFAAGQLGSSAEAALSSLENLGDFMRSNPGAGNFLTRLGVDPAHVGKADLAMKDLAKTFKAMPYYKAKVYANFLGTDENTLRAMLSGMDAFSSKYKDILKLFNIDTEDAAKNSVEFQNALRELGAFGEASATKLGMTLLPVAKHLLQFMQQLIVWAAEVPSALGQFKGAFVGLAAAIGIVFAPFTTLGILIAAIIDDIYTFTEGGKSMIGDMVDGFKELETYLKNSAVGRWFLETTGIGDNSPAPATAQGNSPAPATAQGNSPALGESQNNPGNLRRWGSAPTRNGFAVFGSALEGMSAAAGNLVNYGRRGWNTINSIVDHWAPKADGNNNNDAYKAMLSRTIGVGVNDKLNLNDPTVLANTLRGITRFEQGRDPYAANLYDAAARSRTGGGISQTTTINVTGATDPTATARAISSEQAGVNSKLVRQVQGVPR